MRRLIVFFSLAGLISWIIWLPLYLPYWGISNLPVFPLNHAMGALGPMIAAVIVTALTRGAKGVSRLIQSMISVRSVLLLLVALLSPFVLLIVAVGLSKLNSGYPVALDAIGKTSEFPNLGLGMSFVYNLVFFGFGEEVGWKGVALPILQSKLSALFAATVFTLFWAIWHWPLFLYRPGYTSMDIAAITGWIFSLLTGSILLTWLFNSSCGSILICAVFHATIDIAFVSDIANKNVINYLGMLITFWGTVTVLVFGNKNLSSNRRVTEPLGAIDSTKLL